jgi:preprotein translocase subunit SecG
MISTLLIAIDSLICLALIVVVLMQRSEGGAFGMGGGPTGLITTRGAGDLLTRTTWVLFASFLVVSLTLTLVGSHDKATSSIIEKLKLQHANTSELNQQAPPPAPTPTVPAPGAPAGSPLLAPPIQSAQPLSAPAPQPLTTTVPNLAAPPAAPPAAKPKHVAAPKADAAPAQAATAAPPVIEAPAPKPAPTTPATPAP